MATTTTNFNFPIPQSTDLVKDGATAIAALGTSIDTDFVDLKGGTTGQVLSKASGTDLDFTWVTSDDANAIQNAIVDAKGDIIAATANDTPARLAVGANDLLLTAASGEATGLKYTGGWTTWTPTWTNLTVGNGTLVARYQKIGKTVNYYLNLTFGSTTSVTGIIVYTLPIAPNQTYGGSNGRGLLSDTGVGDTLAVAGGWSPTESFLAAEVASGAYTTVTFTGATVPFTWATNDRILITATYEVA